MIKTLRISFSLKNTYRVNSILYTIKQIPILKKILPDTIYQMWAFKIFANILSVIWEVMSIFLGKFLYFLIMVIMPLGLYGVWNDAEAQLFLHILLCLSVIGAFMNTYIFNPTRDKYYAIILLGMNAKEYTLINYFYAIIKVLLGFMLLGLIWGISIGLSV